MERFLSLHIAIILCLALASRVEAKCDEDPSDPGGVDYKKSNEPLTERSLLRLAQYVKEKDDLLKNQLKDKYAEVKELLKEGVDGLKERLLNGDAAQKEMMQEGDIRLKQQLEEDVEWLDGRLTKVQSRVNEKVDQQEVRLVQDITQHRQEWEKMREDFKAWTLA